MLLSFCSSIEVLFFISSIISSDILLFNIWLFSSFSSFFTSFLIFILFISLLMFSSILFISLTFLISCSLFTNEILSSLIKSRLLFSLFRASILLIIDISLFKPDLLSIFDNKGSFLSIDIILLFISFFKSGFASLSFPNCSFIPWGPSSFSDFSLISLSLDLLSISLFSSKVILGSSLFSLFISVLPLFELGRTKSSFL